LDALFFVIFCTDWDPMGFIPFFHHHGRENMFGWFTFSKHFCSANPNLSAVSFMAGCFPKTPPTMIIFSRKTPWLLGKPTILGSPYFAGKKTEVDPDGNFDKNI